MCSCGSNSIPVGWQSGDSTRLELSITRVRSDFFFKFYLCVTFVKRRGRERRALEVKMIHTLMLNCDELSERIYFTGIYIAIDADCIPV